MSHTQYSELTAELLSLKPETNLRHATDRGFIGDLAAPAPVITFASTPKKRLSKRLVSWPMLFNLLLIWVLVSLAQQVQRLRAEVAFVADEARDLRLYSVERERAERERLEKERAERERERGWWESGAERQSVVEPPHESETLAPPPPLEESTTSTGLEQQHGLGRVVFGSTWQWTEHPV